MSSQTINSGSDTTIPSNPVFDAQSFDIQLLAGAPQLDLFRDTLQKGDKALTERFELGEHAQVLVPERANLIDQLLIRAWRGYWPTDIAPIALIAVGGYGRGELHPKSDIDLMILMETDEAEALQEPIERFLTFLWDIGLEVGHSVRSLKDCSAQALHDITIATNLMEARLLAGPADLFEDMRKSIATDKQWSSREFFQAKWKEQQQRHHKYHDTAYRLEPNFKEGPGGLRDIQMIGWVAKRHFDATVFFDLVDRGFLTEAEHDELMEGQHFLWQIRFSLHVLTGRREDRLLFDYQRVLAEQFGYQDEEDRKAVEHFMKRYYRTVMELSRLNEMLLQLFQEAILYDQDFSEPIPINRRFQARRGFIEATSDDVFLRYPFALLEIFLVFQQHPEFKGIRASTIRLIRTHKDLINDNFRRDLRARSLFMEIMRQPQGITHALRRMNLYGILAAYIPQFGKIVGQLQYDLIHVFTVDEHTLTVVRNLRRFSVPEHYHEFPFCSHLIQKLPKIELLYLAGLFHDIAKGRGGDHSELGGKFATEFCRLHDLSNHDTKLVAWLIQNHLIMSATAQRCDINDPEVINQFATAVGDQSHLDYLYLLTVADIRSTNEEIWNSWKDTLLQELYSKTTRALRRGPLFPLDKDERKRGVKAMALATLQKIGVPRSKIKEFWKPLSDEYFLSYSSDEIAWHTEAITRSTADEMPVVLIRQEERRGSTAIFMYTRDADHLFAVITSALDKMRLTIVDARITSALPNYTFDTYFVLEENGEAIASNLRMQEIRNNLRQQLLDLDQAPKNVTRPMPRQARHFPLKTHVNYTQDEANQRTILELFTADRPGLLSHVGQAFSDFGIRVKNAKITTLGNRAEDVFFIADHQNKPITNEGLLDRLKEKLITDLDD